MKILKRMTLGLLIVAGALLPAAVSAQETVWTYRPQAGGWIGITVDYTMWSVGGETETVAVITEVAEGSPAAGAGILVGDTITLLNGGPVSEELFASLRGTLEPGDLVTFHVERGGRTQEIPVEAGERPRTQIIVHPDPERLVLQLEALRGKIVEDLDSLHVSFSTLGLNDTTGELNVQVLRAPTRLGEEAQIGFRFHFSEAFADSLFLGPDVFLAAPEFALPFEALIVESQEARVLKESLTQLGKQLTEVRREMQSRRKALAAALPGSGEEALRDDRLYQELQAREAELLAQREDLSVQLRRVTEEEMQLQWMEAQERSEEAFQKARRRMQDEALEELQRSRQERDLRAREIYEQYQQQYRSPVIVGQTVLLGAQLKTVNPELAEYFGVEQGVIVLEVMKGSPASEAGLFGGDIITAIADEPVASLSDLRFGLLALEGEEPLTIQVIRKGEPVQIHIRR